MWEVGNERRRAWFWELLEKWAGDWPTRVGNRPSRFELAVMVGSAKPCALRDRRREDGMTAEAVVGLAAVDNC